MFLKIKVETSEDERTDLINLNHVVTVQENTKRGMGIVIHLSSGKFIFSDMTIKEFDDKAHNTLMAYYG